MKGMLTWNLHFKMGKYKLFQKKYHLNNAIVLDENRKWIIKNPKFFPET